MGSIVIEDNMKYENKYGFAVHVQEVQKIP